ncbi:hypothetical protein GS447_28355 [Rhodococcus hoagii]|nr:hypothetical protein [Prescottella equi]
MEAEGEAAQIDRVIDRLAIGTPAVTPAEVERVVRSIHARFVDSRVREFIPTSRREGGPPHFAEQSTPPVDHVAAAWAAAVVESPS